MHIKTDDFYKDIADVVGKGTIPQIILLKDHYQCVRIKKKIGLIKDELGRRIMGEFIGLKPKCYSYSKGTKKCGIK